ncbi:ATP-binding cassette domain-containing protein [Alkalibacterium sp. 20]|uniref:ABC transporter ATP-binding protein/permease n=1 Tax=Alkalibacterium sp. 20 TaxID=1798803 RepID=UPI0009002BED|nr:ABC transporter ATP-binding protein/permease [Alkalibacterium sp. 20]OJF93051.1 ABC transporter ATP-binding protein [Alkalibacterium sp. 20]
MPFLEVNNLNKYYPITDKDRFHALKDVQLSFDKGELVSIIGESGSGKSTLMNVLGGLDLKFEGEIRVDGENIGHFKEKEMVNFHKEKVGFIFQSFNLVPHLSVLDNVTLAMTLSNVDANTRKERAKEVLEHLGLKDHYKKKPSQLSGGQKQRVAIARALVNDPDIIIADEPTGALDSQTSDQVLDIIEEIAKNGKLVIMVTHSERVASRSTRVVTIDDGKIINDEKRKNIHDHKNTFQIKKRQENKNLGFFAAIRMALLNMKEKLGRNILIALGASIGIMSVILMLALGNGVNDYLTDTMNENVNPMISEARMTEETQEEADEELDTEAPAEQGGGGPGNLAANNPIVQLSKNIAFEESNIAELETIPHVEEIELAYSSFSIGSDTVVYEDESYPFMNFGTISANMTDSNILYGSFPENSEVLITEEMAENVFSTAEDMIGEEVEVKLSVNGSPLTGNYTVSGIYTAGNAIGPASAYDSVFMTMDTFADMNEENGLTVEPNLAYLYADEASKSQMIKDEISDLGYAGSSTDTLAETFTQMLDIFTYILSGVAGISLFVSAIMILTVLYISVVERTQEIGVLKAIGGRNKDIRRIFVSESFLIGLFSGLLGVGIASFISMVGNIAVENLFGTTILHMTPAYALFGILASIVISVVAGVFPANKAARLDPIEALRHD